MYTDCPNNFLGEHSHPHLFQRFWLQFRRSDTTPRVGIAMIHEDVFIGWIVMADFGMVWPMVQVSGESGDVVDGVVVDLESF